MSSYFNLFPVTLHSNSYATNITVKLRLSEKLREQGTAFYTYTVTEGERPDTIAYAYYGDASLDWIVYLSNDIVDPYHEWPKSENDMREWINTKYGSIASAQARTAFYFNNYESDIRALTVAAYEALSAAQKQYWAPVLDYNGNVASYERKKLDAYSETNRLVRLQGTFETLSAGTLLSQGDARGTVDFANTSQIVLKHITGTWNKNDSVTVAVTGTSVNTTITDASTVVDEDGNPVGIPADELAYWTAKSVYDYEYEVNESKKHIRLLDAGYVRQILADKREALT